MCHVRKCWLAGFIYSWCVKKLAHCWQCFSEPQFENEISNFFDILYWYWRSKLRCWKPNIPGFYAKNMHHLRLSLQKCSGDMLAKPLPLPNFFICIVCNAPCMFYGANKPRHKLFLNVCQKLHGIQWIFICFNGWTFLYVSLLNY